MSLKFKVFVFIALSILCINKVNATCDVLNCKTCVADDPTKCQECQDNFYVGSDTKCAGCPANCKTCPANKCTTCVSNSFVVTKTDTCVACVDAPLAECLTCDSLTNCLTCKSESFVIKEGKCQTCESAGLTNCLTCSALDTCKTCKAGNYLNAEKKCVACTAGCSECNGEGLSKCTACSAGFFLTGTACAACKAGCSACKDAADKCTACSAGFFLTGTTCEACKAGCSACDTADKCTACSAGFFLTGTTCAACKAGCSACKDAADKCTACSAGLFLTGTTCEPCKAGCSACKDAADKCSACSDGFALVESSCTACTSPCKTCSTSVTTCTSCVDDSGLNGAVCQVNDCKTNTTAPYTWIGKPKECTDCKDNVIINKALCKESTIPTVTVAVSDFVYTATIACKAKSVAYLLYSLSQTVTLYNQTQVTALDEKKYTRNLVERSQWLQVEKKTTADDGTTTHVISLAKNSGEIHNVVLFCQSSADSTVWSRSLGVAIFPSKNADIKGLTIAFTGLTSALKAEQKLAAAKKLQTELGVWEVLTDDNQGSLDPTPTTGRILQTTTANFYALPDYSLTQADPKIAAALAKVDPALVTKVGLTGTATGNLTSFLGESVALDNAFPTLVVAKDSLKLSLKLIGTGSPKVNIFYKALTAKQNNTSTTSAYEAVYSTISSWSKVNGTVNATAATEFTLPSLTAGTSYQLHYYLENTAVPVLRSAVFGQIGTTEDETTGLINLKAGLVSLIVLVMAIFA